MEAKMADPPGEGWPSFLSETMPGLDSNFSSDRGMNESTIGDFDGKSFAVFLSARNAWEIQYFLLKEQCEWSFIVLFTRQIGIMFMSYS